MNDPLFAAYAIAIVAFMVVIVVLFRRGIRNGAKIRHTNEQIERNQREIMEISIRQVEALERIATALENRE